MAFDTYREFFDLVNCLCDTAQETIQLSALQKQISKEMVAKSRALINNGRAIERKITKTNSLTSRGLLSLARLKKVQNHIDIHLNERLTLDELAEVACLSPYHFSRSFKRTVGIGPQRYLLRQRLERAKLLMQGTDEGLASIAQETGFTDQSHLTAVFRRETGMTPGRYRKSLATRRTTARGLAA